MNLSRNLAPGPRIFGAQPIELPFTDHGADMSILPFPDE
jgi:hypothetical protein